MRFLRLALSITAFWALLVLATGCSSSMPCVQGTPFTPGPPLATPAGSLQPPRGQLLAARAAFVPCGTPPAGPSGTQVPVSTISGTPGFHP